VLDLVPADLPPALFALICGVLGLLVGSFLNVVIHRLPTMMEREWRNHCAELCGDEAPQHEPLSLARPGSRCPACGHAITALENIPLLSWLFLRGRCSACAAPISLRYPLVEAISGLLCAFAAFHFGYGWTSLAAMLLIWSLIALTGIDFDSQLLPDSITLPLLWAGLLSIFSALSPTCKRRSSGRCAAILPCGLCIGRSN
jgi:leader peptidase (prepilin peptidase)/N-methyltransferase